MYLLTVRRQLWRGRVPGDADLGPPEVGGGEDPGECACFPGAGGGPAVCVSQGTHAGDLFDALWWPVRELGCVPFGREV